MEFLVNFKNNYLGPIWLLGLFFGLILLINFIYSKIQDMKFEKKMKLKKIEQLNVLNNKKQQTSL